MSAIKTKDSESKRVKPTLESLLKDSQLQTGKDLIKRIKAKELELEQFQKSVEFEERNRKLKNSTIID